MDREEYFAKKLENEEWLSAEELDELINYFNVDNIQAPENFIPVAFNGRVWMIPFTINPLMVHQPVEAEEHGRGEWYPIKSRKEILATIEHERYIERIMKGFTLEEFADDR